MSAVLRAVWQAFFIFSRRKTAVERYRDQLVELVEGASSPWPVPAVGLSNLDEQCATIDGYCLVVQALRHSPEDREYEVSVCLRDEQLRWLRTFRAGFSVTADGTTRALRPDENQFWWDRRDFADSRNVAVKAYRDELAARGAEELLRYAGTHLGHASIHELSTTRAGSDLSVLCLQRGEDDLEVTVWADRGQFRPEAIAGLLVSDRQRVERLTDDQLAARGYC